MSRFGSTLLAWIFAGPVAAAERQNVLFIAVDDLKPLLGCYGEAQIQSPHIDRLAARGTVFLNAHCQQAVCGPSRASLLTGRRPDTIRVWDLKTKIREVNPGIVTLPEHFKRAGFQTAALGKIFDPRNVDGRATHDTPSWSISYTPSWELPFSEATGKPVDAHYQSAKARRMEQKAIALGLESYQEMADFLASKNFHPVLEFEDVPDNAYEDGAITDKALGLMRALGEAEAPFFLAIGFKKPHLPFVAPKKYWDRYNHDEIELHPFQERAADSPEIAYHDSNELREYSDIPKEGPIPAELQADLIHGYYACVTYIDAQVGRLLDALEELGLDENTVIVLWGDHGWHLGDHGLWCKHTNFEQATRSPLIIAAPGFEGGAKSKAPVEFVDLFPTLTELAGIETPGGLDGVSLVPVLENSDATVKEYAVSQFPRHEVMGYALRTERYRYVAWLEKSDDDDIATGLDRVEAEELYDYEKDPMEKVNVADDPAHAKIAGELSAMLNEHLMDGAP